MQSTAPDVERLGAVAGAKAVRSCTHRTGNRRDGRRAARSGRKLAAPGSPADSPACLVAIHAGHTPRLPRGFVARPRLMGLLAAECDASLVLLTAPAGYGKTSLLAEWALEDERPFTWVTITAAHDEPAQLLRTLVDALECTDGLDGVAARRISRRARDGAPLPELLKAMAELSSAIGRARRSAVLVLDDVEVLQSDESRSLLKALAAGLPAGVLLAIASRATPSLSLGRMRAAGALIELDAGDLALDGAEACDLIRAGGLELSDSERARLIRLTEGWPAALALSIRVLRHEADPAAALDHLTGHDHALAQYVDEEVLRTAPEDARDFLARTSILELLSPVACDAVLERTDSGSVLSEVATSGLMVTPVAEDDGSYRCHPLLRAVLRAELERVDPASALRLHRRAGDWFLERGEIDDAIEHVVAAGDAAWAGGLIWDHCGAYFAGKRVSQVARWLDRLGDERLGRSAPLSLCAAHRDFACGDLGGAEHWARVALGALEQSEGCADVDSLEAGIAIVQAAAGRNGLERMAQDAARAYELEGEGSPWRGLCALLLGVADHLAGEHSHAREALEDGAARSAGAAPRVEALCLSQLALIADEEGDRECAAELADRACVRIESAGVAGQAVCALVFAIGASIAAQAGEADTAKRHLHRGLRLLPALGEYMPWHEAETRVALARASIRLLDVPLARHLLSDASRAARRMPNATVLRAWLDETWAEIDGVGVAALNGAGSLTTAELRILRFLPTHLSFREIGSRLHVSTNTVKSQAHAVYSKLDVASRADAVARASALGLIEAEVT